MENDTNSVLYSVERAKKKIADKFPTSLDYDFEITPMNSNDWKTVPIIINSYNRKKYLTKQIEYFKINGYTNIYVIDNKSTYPPLLNYYKKEKLKVFYLSENVGYLSLWQTSIFDLFIDKYYVYTDSDVVPCEDTPSDFVSKFADILDRYSFLDKVGFSLLIDDLPENSQEAKNISLHEQKFWLYDINNEFYFSPIDTTLALYRPNAKGGWWLKSGRTKMPYLAHHLPWYENAKNLSEDDKFYYNSVTKSTYWSHSKVRGKFIRKLRSILKLIKR